jgi:hypothetical protein
VELEVPVEAQLTVTVTYRRSRRWRSTEEEVAAEVVVMGKEVAVVVVELQLPSSPRTLF